MWPSGPGEVPFRSVCGAEPVCALLKFAIFLFFFQVFFFAFFRGGSNMVAFRTKVDGKWQAKFQRRLRYRATGLRPSGLPNLPFSVFFSLLPSFFLKHFSTFSNNFPSLPLIFRLFQRFLVQATRLQVTTLSAMCHKAQDTETNATCCGRGFCLFLRILRHIQKKGPNYVNSIKRKVLRFT